jgi:membrane protease YdiL (CAAX protease family)
MPDEVTKMFIPPRRQARKEKPIFVFRTLAPFASLRETFFFRSLLQLRISNTFGWIFDTST